MTRKKRNGWAAVAGCLMLSVVALLLWGRLKLVAGVPRTALADPEAKAAAERADQVEAARKRQGERAREAQAADEGGGR